MIGLLRKDQTLLWSSYGKNFLLVGALYTIMSCLSDSMVFVLYALVFLGGMYAVSTLSMDEQSQWDAYVRTLPVTPGQIVGSKYLLTLGWRRAGRPTWRGAFLPCWWCCCTAR